MPIDVIETHSIFPRAVRCGGIVIDCGANLGRFSLEMIGRYGCRCYAFEASPSVFAHIPFHPNLVSKNIAICGSDRVVVLALSDDITRNRIGTGEDSGLQVNIQGRHLGRTVKELGITQIEVLKMDIEGAELEVIDSLEDEFFRNIGQITIEFHDFLGYATAQAVEQRVTRLINIGFREFFWSRRRNNGDVLLVNSQRVSTVRHIYEQAIVRRAKAGARMWRRLRQASKG
jgi:FkbM family methyltransferase